MCEMMKREQATERVNWGDVSCLLWLTLVGNTKSTGTSMETRDGCSSTTCPPLAQSGSDQYRNSLLFASCTTHCSPACRFVPVMALHAIMVHLCVRIASRRRP